MTAPDSARWRRSSYSNGNGGQCIEVDDAHPGRVRDSKDPGGPVLEFTPAAWAAFVAATATGRSFAYGGDGVGELDA
ncbi:DUF397 domain-containing protein [Kitasatospora phosalacinea]|uniref:DUF397 domain-containing protein n=1 Tax=Kitasatospora phosalacinea TaxID=2065 RepID=UPI00068FD78B|nr:DUF397 domain-containing protein [Kitasatospora phosalacinea]